MRHIQALQAEIDLQLDESSFAPVVQRWFELGLGFAPHMVDAADRREPGWLSTFVIGDLLGKAVRINPLDLGQMTEALAVVHQRRVEASLDIEWRDPSVQMQSNPITGEQTYPMPDSPFSFFRLEARRPSSDMPSWVRLTVGGGISIVHTGELRDDLLGDNYGAELAQRWPEIVADVIDDAQVAFGAITADWRYPSEALDLALRRHTEVSLAESARFLRGYSWVTVCPRALVSRLGGAAALAASGSFVRVRELRSGDLLLQATDLPHQFDRAALRAVWRALAPILPPGPPKDVPLEARPPELVMEDAAAAESRE